MFKFLLSSLYAIYSTYPLVFCSNFLAAIMLVHADIMYRLLHRKCNQHLVEEYIALVLHTYIQQHWVEFELFAFLDLYTYVCMCIH